MLCLSIFCFPNIGERVRNGERIQFNELLTLIKKIISTVTIPVSIDVESGFSENEKIVTENILKIADLGAVGINIEDSLKVAPGLKDKDKHCELIEKIRTMLDKHGYNKFFINARTDTYFLQNDPLEETIDRSISYINSGADGIFVPGLYQCDEIKKLAESIGAPLNVMSLPNLTDANSLNKLGVKRFSIGNAFSDSIISSIEDKAQILATQKNTESLYTHCKVKTSFK